jgi:hypothetical protein
MSIQRAENAKMGTKMGTNPPKALLVFIVPIR